MVAVCSDSTWNLRSSLFPAPSLLITSRKSPLPNVSRCRLCWCFRPLHSNSIQIYVDGIIIVGRNASQVGIVGRTSLQWNSWLAILSLSCDHNSLFVDAYVIVDNLVVLVRVTPIYFFCMEI